MISNGLRISSAIAATYLAASVLFGGAAFGANRPIAPEDLAGLRDIGGHSQGAISLSPDRRWIAFQLQEPDFESNDYKSTWFALATASPNVAKPMGDGGDVLLNPEKADLPTGDRVPARAVWAPDSRSFFFLKKKNEEVQVWRASLEDARQEQVTHSRGDVLTFELSADGSRVLFTAARPRDELAERLRTEARRGYLIDDHTVPYAGIAPRRQWCPATNVSMARDCAPKMQVLELRVAARAPLVRVESKSQPPLPPTVPEDLVRRRAPAPDGKGVAWLQVINPKTRAASNPKLRVHARAGGGVRACDFDACVGDNFHFLVWSEDSKELFFMKSDVKRLHFSIFGWSPARSAIRTIVGDSSELSSCASGGENIFCVREAPTEPRRIVSIDVRSGKISELFDPNPSFKEIEFTKIEDLSWEDRWGNRAEGKLVYPAGYREGERYPLIIAPYTSKGFLRGDTGDEYPIHAFAASGFFVLSASGPVDEEMYHVTPASERILVTERDLRKRRTYFSSIENIIPVLNRRGLIDPKRIGMTGLSDGAQQVHFALINSDLIAAAAVSSLVAPETWYRLDAPRRRSDLRLWWGGPPSPDNASYKALSYSWNMESIKSPLLINVGEEEFSISYPQFADMVEAGKAVEMHAYPAEGHIKWRPAHRLSIYKRNLQWFRFWLQGVEDPDPVDPEQYTRWRNLRERCQACRANE